MYWKTRNWSFFIKKMIGCFIFFLGKPEYQNQKAHDHLTHTAIHVPGENGKNGNISRIFNQFPMICELNDPPP